MSIEHSSVRSFWSGLLRVLLYWLSHGESDASEPTMNPHTGIRWHVTGHLDKSGHRFR